MPIFAGASHFGGAPVGSVPRPTPVTDRRGAFVPQSEMHPIFIDM
jgi:hypothetical protein